MNKKKIIKFLIKLLISLVLINLLVYKINWNEVLLYTQRISVFQIILYIAILVFGMVISSYKWQILSRFKGFDFPLIKYFQLYLAGTFINNFLPSFVGGDTYRAYQIGKDGKKYSSSAAAVVMDRITGLIAAMILSVFFAVLNIKVIIGHKILTVIIGLIVIALIALLFVGLIIKAKIWKKTAAYMPEKVLEIVKDFSQYWGTQAFAKSLFFGVIYSFVGLACLNYILFWSLGIQIEILNYLTVIFLVSIVSSIPISVNNIGIKEWAYVTFFGFFGISASAVVTVAIVSRILQMLVSFAALPVYLRNKK